MTGRHLIPISLGAFLTPVRAVLAETGSVRYMAPGRCVCYGKITDLDLRDKPE